MAAEAPRPPRPPATFGAVEPSNDRPGFDALAAALAAELAPALVEPVAVRVAELLREAGEGPRMMSAAEVAARLGRSRDWVYAHRAELGAVALGSGPRPRLGFPAERVAAYSAGSGPNAPETAPASGARRRRRRASGQRADLLPIRGEAPR